MKVATLALPFVFLTFPAKKAAPHILEDGFVERSLFISIRDGVGKGEYRIGFNNNTMNQLLESWQEPSQDQGSDSNQPNSIESSDGNTLPKSSSGSESKDTPKWTNPSEKNSPANQPTAQSGETSSSAPDSNELPSNTEGARRKPATQRAKIPAPDAPTESQGETASGEESEAHWLDPGRLEMFKKVLQNRVKEELEIVCNETEIRITKVRLGPPPRHPFYVAIEFEFQPPTERVFNLQIHDRMFVENEGALRYALKTFGRQMLLNSNVAPTITRAKRIELKGKSREERGKLSTITAKIASAPVESSDKK